MYLLSLPVSGSFQEGTGQFRQGEDAPGNIERPDEKGEERHKDSGDDAGCRPERREQDAGEDHEPAAGKRADGSAPGGKHLDGKNHHEEPKLGASRKGQHAEVHGNQEDPQEEHEDPGEQEHGPVEGQTPVAGGGFRRLGVFSVDLLEHQGETEKCSPESQDCHTGHGRGEKVLLQDEKPREHGEEVDGHAAGDQGAEDAAVLYPGAELVPGKEHPHQKEKPPGEQAHEEDQPGKPVKGSGYEACDDACGSSGHSCRGQGSRPAHVSEGRPPEDYSLEGEKEEKQSVQAILVVREFPGRNGKEKGPGDQHGNSRDEEDRHVEGKVRLLEHPESGHEMSPPLPSAEISTCCRHKAQTVEK